MSDSAKEYSKYVRETIREDGGHKSHPYEHLNYEVWLDLKGSKKERSKQITNVHIPISQES